MHNAVTEKKLYITLNVTRFNLEILRINIFSE